MNKLVVDLLQQKGLAGPLKGLQEGVNKKEKCFLSSPDGLGRACTSF
jgi:hypothetical protein